MKPGIARWLRGALRAPLLHFLLAGGALAALRPDPLPEITLGAAAVDRIHREFLADAGRPPRATELHALFDAAIDEEILLREAWAAGRLRHDGAVVARLQRLGSFVGPDGGSAPAAAVDRARDLGLDARDPVIRRYLVERSRLSIASEADHPPPDEAALQVHLRRHPERFETPERWRLQHVFVSSRRGADTEARAAEIGARLHAGASADDPMLGDAFPQGRHFVATHAELDRTFGPGFSNALDRAGSAEPDGPEHWQGPIRSAHGLHWVRLEARIPTTSPDLAAVRGRVLQDLVQERRAAHLRERLDDLRSRYRIRIEARS